MNALLDTGFWPLAFFVKLAPVSRTTLENWMRSGALVAALDSEPDSEPEAFSGKMFSIRNMLKVEIMHRLVNGLGSAPRHAAKVADQVIEDNVDVIEAEFRAAVTEGYDRSDRLTSDFRHFYSALPEGKSPSVARGIRALDDLCLVVPIGSLARRCYRHYAAYELGTAKVFAQAAKAEARAAAEAEVEAAADEEVRPNLKVVK